MSINQRYAVDETKVRHMGKLYSSIDFELVEGVDKLQFKNTPKRTVAGTFYIGDRSFTVTLGELDRIIETAQNAKEVFIKAYKLGRL